ncbi:hypothetical protein AB0M48_05545 [Lentzea sp. NPDC051208]|uniref:hypothetical protein n=1 Tax=Lentzea sp. NPDC051208 TaxID=3154642 RepID=UPI003436A706
MLLYQIIGLTGLVAMLAALVSDGWLACGLGMGGLVLVSARPASRAPTVNTAMLWGTAAALGFGVSMTQLLPVQPLTWTSLLTAVVLGYGSYYKMLSVSYAAETPRLSHIWWHLTSVLLVPTAVLLALSATISGTVEAVVAHVAAGGALLLAFPFRGDFPPQWQTFRRAARPDPRVGRGDRGAWRHPDGLDLRWCREDGDCDERGVASQDPGRCTGGLDPALLLDGCYEGQQGVPCQRDLPRLDRISRSRPQSPVSAAMRRAWSMWSDGAARPSRVCASQSLIRARPRPT